MRDLFFFPQNVAAPPDFQPAVGVDQAEAVAACPPAAADTDGVLGSSSEAAAEALLGRCTGTPPGWPEDKRAGRSLVCLVHSCKWSIAICWKNDGMNEWLTSVRPERPETTLLTYGLVTLHIATLVIPRTPFYVHRATLAGGELVSTRCVLPDVTTSSLCRHFLRFPRTSAWSYSTS